MYNFHNAIARPTASMAGAMGVNNWEPYQAPDMDLGERPEEFGDLPEQYRQMIRGQALAAMGANIMRGGSKNLGANLAAGASDYQRIRAEALRQAGLDHDRRQETAARLQGYEADDARRKGEEFRDAQEAMARIVRDRGEQEQLKSLLGEAPPEAREYFNQVAQTQGPAAAVSELTKYRLDQQRTKEQARQEQIEKEREKAAARERYARVYGEEHADTMYDISQMDDANVRDEAMRKAGIKAPSVTMHPVERNGRRVMTGRDIRTGREVWSVDVGPADSEDKARTAYILSSLRKASGVDPMEAAFAASEGVELDTLDGSDGKAVHDFVKEQAKIYDSAMGALSGEEFAGDEGTETGGEPKVERDPANPFGSTDKERDLLNDVSSLMEENGLSAEEAVNAAIRAGVLSEGEKAAVLAALRG